MSGAFYRAKKLNNKRISLYKSSENKGENVTNSISFLKTPNVISQNSKLSELNELYNESKRERNRLTMQNSQLTKKIQLLTQENSQFSNKIQSLIEENNQLSEKNKDLIDENEVTSERNQELTQENMEISERNQQLVNENGELLVHKENFASKCNEIKELQYKYDQLLKLNKALIEKNSSKE